ncbi:3-carboxy-cis,cis-muconate cycloisomerase [Streptomyces sp. PSKA54]|uniref:3-carboxy-cis,cis-muconate cycloisomerase n=1 Tax=Streptomyces himalayensis subsp. aureolus TaxID=2758039 RepID=A0A7W2HJJ2_9ACTN|nr:3-carboxy-cis,cis-muconate cycloisomerase [Streptomyces himalayensis]MBA4866176.1 3-carboxy-cis,cis-muconate cycloisomerase [Streptomyces himalayensis subsp. aureolus]
MTSVDPDAGLLAPGRAGSPAESATSDTAFLQALLDAEAALTRAQAATGLAPAEAAEAVTAAADAARFDIRDIALRARGGGNPVIPLVGDLTVAVPAEYAPYVHRGATSQDIMDTAMMLVASRTLDVVLADLARTEQALARLAAAHRDTVMPGRTLTQHAVPTTFGLKAAGWRSLVLDARDRVRAVRDGLPAQLGGAAGTLAAFLAFGADLPTVDVLVTAYARELGLAEPLLPWHTLRTPVADLASALAFTVSALGKPATDVLILSRTEIGELSEGTGGGSSAMPHKANPVRSTLIAAAARRAPHLAATLYGSLAAEDERPAGAWHAEWEPLRDLLRLTGGAARDTAELAEGLQVHPETMREHLDMTHGLIVSERLAAELTPHLGRARAKALLTDAAKRTRTEGRALSDILAEAPDLADQDLAELTDPTRYTGSAGVLTDRALERR